MQKGVLLVSGNKSLGSCVGGWTPPWEVLSQGDGQGFPALQTKQDVGRLKMAGSRTSAWSCDQT